ncbi:MAG: hypothetical protein C0516_06935 [Gemmatimonas sp.]|jgi:hypothetical protein|uniref:hypothetical protein n=1 Tax=Gemmatimonas sp. UBA7669 TaxID=1946568 RepID=UPI0025C6F8B3|nr:hypothetical protein [Gemmatimonas sp. UBA7669]MBA3918303.1 hypothetical protein [Gemmatimonas sp.]
MLERLSAVFDSDLLLVGILVLIVIEAVVLIGWQRRSGARQVTPHTAGVLPLLTFLGAGGSLVVAMIFHRRPEPAPEGFAVAMLCALVIHLWHLAVLLRR